MKHEDVSVYIDGGDVEGLVVSLNQIVLRSNLGTS